MANFRSEYTIGLKDEVSRPLARITSGLDKFKVAVGAIGAIGAAGAIASVTSRITAAVNIADSLNKAAQKAGVTVEALSALDYAARLSDVSTESLTGGLAKLSRTMAQAAAGIKAPALAFQALGVSVKNSGGDLRNTADVFSDIGKAIAALPDGATKTALAIQIFGKSGAELIPLLNGGADGFEAITAEAKQFGAIISKDLAQQSENLKDNFERLRIASTALGISLATDIVPGLANLSTEFVKSYRESSGLLRVFEALGITIAGFARGTDQGRLGELLADEIGLEKKIADVNRAFADGNTGKLTAFIQLKRLRAELASTRAEAEGLRVALPDSAQGKGGRDEDKPAGPSAADRQAAEQRARALLDNAGATEKRKTEQDKLDKAQADYLAKLRQQLTLENESTELAKVKADIQFGAAAKFAPAAQAEALALADSLDVLKDSAEVHQALIGYVTERAQLEEQSTKQLAEHRQAVIESLQTPLENYIERVKELAALDLSGDTLQRGIALARTEMESAQTKASELKGTVKDLGLTFTSAFEDAVIGGKALSDVIKGLIQDIARLLIRKSVTEPLINALGGFFDGGGSASLGSAIAGYGSRFGFGGARASGGSVAAGKYYKVGERGPEYFAPGQNGAIIPTAGGEGWNVTIINNSGQPAQQRQTGRRSLEVTIGELMAGNVAAGRAGAFGLRPALAGR